MVEFSAEIAPHRNSLAGFPPGCECEAEHMQRAQHRSRPHPESEQQTHPDKQFDHADHISEKYRVRQNQVGQNGLVETHRPVLDEALKVLLEPAVGKSGAENLVLAE